MLDAMLLPLMLLIRLPYFFLRCFLYAFRYWFSPFADVSLSIAAATPLFSRLPPFAITPYAYFSL